MRFPYSFVFGPEILYFYILFYMFDVGYVNSLLIKVV